MARSRSGRAWRCVEPGHPARPPPGGYGSAMTLVAQHVSLDPVQVSSIKSVY
ncbi:hypothetical protein [Nonomuraea dietziae]|uniref:hypothetical protein n=1 Tax=Nonomuraea dietziae TaxID=65515 RepID=UPI00342D364D